MSEEELIIDGLAVGIFRKKNLKNLYIHVDPPYGNISVKTPIDLSDEEIKLFVLKKIPEIVKVRNRMISQERQSKREYVSGESCYLWGKPYRLQVVYGGAHKTIEKTGTKIIMTVPVGTEIKAREKLLLEWYRQELKRVLDSVIQRCELKIGICATEYRIKNMKTKWGTCNTQERRIWINLQLAKKPIECLEYIVIHEMVHLLEDNHTHRFYALVKEYCPSWKEARRLLDLMPLDYMDNGETEVDDERTDAE